MKNSIFIALLASLNLSYNTAVAYEQGEKCKIIKDGKGLIKAGKADCASSSHSCAGLNLDADPDSWIMVPLGQCTKINSGDYSSITPTIKDKIEDLK